MGEIEITSPGVMKGYYRQPELTAEAFTEDGWLKTGDRGSMDDDGYVRITGRVKEIFKTSKGKYVAPGPIETPMTKPLFDNPEMAEIMNGLLAATPLAQTPPDVPQPAWAVELGEDGLYPHLASPDVWVDEDTRCLRMLVHGLASHGEQVSYAASSYDALDWHFDGPEIPLIYLRRFTHRSQVYAMGHGGQLSRALPDGGFEPGPHPIPGQIRHVAVLVRGDRLEVAFSRIGDAPERILHTALDISRPWPDWPTASTSTAWAGATL